jgi:hypothetical protein
VSLTFFQEEEEEREANIAHGKAKNETKPAAVAAPRKKIGANDEDGGKFTTTVKEVSSLRFPDGNKVNWEIVADQLGTTEAILRQWREDNYNVSVVSLPCLYQAFAICNLCDMASLTHHPPHPSMRLDVRVRSYFLLC